MSVMMIIFGIVMIAGGVACLLTPISTTFSLMYFYMILLFATGVVFLIQSIAYRRFIDFIFALFSLAAGGFIVFSPNLAFVTETILLYVTAIWLVIRGIVGVVYALRAKRATGGGPIVAFAIIASLLVVGAGVYSFIHPLVFAKFLGILASCYFIVEGIDLVMAGSLGRKIGKMIENQETEES